MKLIWRWPLTPGRNQPMDVEQAVKHALSDPDPYNVASEQAEMMARLIHVLHSKGILLPAEVVQVIGKHSYEEYHAD
jgi:hypothetical protein